MNSTSGNYWQTWIWIAAWVENYSFNKPSSTWTHSTMSKRRKLFLKLSLCCTTAAAEISFGNELIFGSLQKGASSPTWMHSELKTDHLELLLPSKQRPTTQTIQALKRLLCVHYYQSWLPSHELQRLCSGKIGQSARQCGRGDCGKKRGGGRVREGERDGGRKRGRVTKSHKEIQNGREGQRFILNTTS